MKASPSARRRRAGFTLIELLIVIAIIAILAMIAVPNFLEAQVRAKTSRAMADMATLATAIESYTIDWGSAPLDWRVCTHQKAVPAVLSLQDAQAYEARIITTPVAYITSMPQDPFKAGGWRHDEGRYFGYRYLNFMAWAGGQLGPSAHDGGHPHFIGAAGLGYMWCLESIGPGREGARFSDNDTRSPWPPRIVSGEWYTGGAEENNKDVAYDPTNGTMSTGQIIRTNKGHFTGRPGH